MYEGPDFERHVGIGILTVVAVLSWPVWGVIIAGKHEFTWAVAASALVPLVLTLAVAAFAMRLPKRASQHYHHAAHSLGEQLHGSSHRHA
ncbi:MAG: hypothetical protein ACJ740_15360 [Gaiellales bacterium]|jgi:hypothetical protein